MLVTFSKACVTEQASSDGMLAATSTNDSVVRKLVASKGSIYTDAVIMHRNGESQGKAFWFV